MMKKIEKWEDCGRDDLSNIPLAIQKGWTPEFDHKDKMNGRTTIENVPHECVSFKKGNKSAWKCYRNCKDPNPQMLRGVPYQFNSLESYWQVADLIDNHYRNHRQYADLSQAFEKE
ncbi:MAG TPA: hypothetical protein VK172_10280 [Lentimicrobium sp.]|nr:hypothetical protein [Lentimicrobium sp.]